MKPTILFLAISIPVSALASAPSARAPSRSIALADQPVDQPQKREFSGRHVDVNFNFAEVRNVLEFLADAGQVKLLLPGDLTDRVVVQAHDTPWDQVFDVVTRAQDLAYEREGNTIRVRRVKR